MTAAGRNTTSGSERAIGGGCSVVELRRYALHRGAREAMIGLFDRELVETQEAVGMQVLGQFRDLDDPDAFVWLRGYRDMPTRGRALPAFYYGPVWKQHADAANATMVDSDNVLLLRPVHASEALSIDPAKRPPRDATAIPAGMFTATICQLVRSADTFADFFERELEPALRDAGAQIVAGLATEHSANNFPRLPVREGEEVFVWLARFPDQAAHARFDAQVDVPRAVADWTDAPPETWRLTPTSRSLLGGSGR